MTAQEIAREAQKNFTAALKARQAADLEQQKVAAARPGEDDPAGLAKWAKASQAARAAAEKAREDEAAARKNAEKVMTGLRVHTWQAKGEELAPTPGWLHRLGQDGRWDLGIFLLGALSVRHGQAHSESPKAGCWSWMPNGVV